MSVHMTPFDAFVKEPDPVTTFLVTPYVPMGGIVFLYGKASIGK